jgi:hypothetical protein
MNERRRLVNDGRRASVSGFYWVLAERAERFQTPNKSPIIIMPEATTPEAATPEIGESRRPAAEPEPPSWLAAIRRAKAAAWDALPAQDKERAAEALKEWREKRERERARRESGRSTEN